MVKYNTRNLDHANFWKNIGKILKAKSVSGETGDEQRHIEYSDCNYSLLGTIIFLKKLIVYQSWRHDGTPSKPVTSVEYTDSFGNSDEIRLGRYANFYEYTEDVTNLESGMLGDIISCILERIYRDYDTETKFYFNYEDGEARAYDENNNFIFTIKIDEDHYIQAVQWSILDFVSDKKTELGSLAQIKDLLDYFTSEDRIKNLFIRNVIENSNNKKINESYDKSFDKIVKKLYME